MIAIQSKGKPYGVKHYTVDDLSDLDLIRLDLSAMGSTAYVISTGERYIVSGNNTWVLIPQPGGNSGGGGGGEDEPTDDTIVYDGGEVLG